MDLPNGYGLRAKYLPVLIILLSFFFISGCDNAQGKAERVDAERQVERLHRLANAGDYLPCYVSMGPEFKKAMSEAQFIDFMGEIKKQAGQYKQGQLKNSTLHNGNRLILTYYSEYSAKSIIEVFGFDKTENGLELSYYNADVYGHFKFNQMGQAVNK